MLKNQRGSVLLLVIVSFAIFLAMLGFALDRGIRLFKNIHQTSLDDVALNLAEAGVEFALYKIMTSEGDFSGEDNVILDTGTFSTSISYLASSGKIEIYSKGIVKRQWKNKTFHKTLRVVISIDQEHPEDLPVMYSREVLL